MKTWLDTLALISYGLVAGYFLDKAIDRLIEQDRLWAAGAVAVVGVFALGATYGAIYYFAARHLRGLSRKGAR